MSTTPRTALPLLAAAQAQKHVTHNDALVLLDTLVAPRVLDRDLTAPPGAPADGDAYLVAAGATGDWSGQDGKIAYCIDGGWRFAAPFAGLTLYVADENVLLLHDGTGFTDITALISFQNLPLVGVNATADTTNKLAVKSAAVLFDNIGAGVQFKVNKSAVGDTASLLYQTGYSGRAEIGLTGDDDFHFKVSPDGSSWTEALKLDKTTGLATLAGDPTASLHAATKQYADAAGAWGDPVAVWNWSSAVANVDITGLGAYRQLLVIAWGLQHNAGGTANFYLRLSTDNGSSFASSGYLNYGNGAITDSVQISSSVASSLQVAFEARILDFNVASRRTTLALTQFEISTTAAARPSLGVRDVSETNNALRLTVSSGQIAAGTMLVYGRM